MFHIVPVAEASVLTLIQSINKVVINPIIFFLFAVAITYFLYGVAQYFLSPDSEEIRKKSKSHMIWGIVGLFIMVGVFGIMNVLLKTFKITNVQVNNNGDFNVDGTNLDDRNIKESAKSGKDLFGNSLDVSSDVNAPDLPESTFVNNPFATYKEDPLVCWHRPIFEKANTEYAALDLVTRSARALYLDQNHISPTDKKKEGYPVVFETKILYDKAHKQYYAWLDVRAPVAAGIMLDCSLEVLKEAPVLPPSSVFSSVVATNDEINLSTTVSKSVITDYTKSPFTKLYVANDAVCWRDVTYSTATTEYQALQKVKAKVREGYLHVTGFVDKDTPGNLPKAYGIFTALDKVTKNYYAWIDARGSMKGAKGKDTDCDLNEVLQIVNESQKPNPLLGSYASNMTYYRIISSGVDTTYVGARGVAINNALVQIAQLKKLPNTSSIIYTTLPEEKYYPPTPATATSPAYPYYDYWLVVEAKR